MNRSGRFRRSLSLGTTPTGGDERRSSLSEGQRVVQEEEEEDPPPSYSEIERQDAAAGLRATRRTRRRAVSSVAAAAGSASTPGLDGPAASSTGVVDPDEDPEEDFGGFRRRCQSMGVTLREVQTGKRFVGQI